MQEAANREVAVVTKRAARPEDVAKGESVRATTASVRIVAAKLPPRRSLRAAVRRSVQPRQPAASVVIATATSASARRTTAASRKSIIESGIRFRIRLNQFHNPLMRGHPERIPCDRTGTTGL